jgi:hypothetical protein
MINELDLCPTAIAEAEWDRQREDLAIKRRSHRPGWEA